MGYQYFPFSQSQGYDPQTCADACNAQTTYDSENLAADGSYMACVRAPSDLSYCRANGDRFFSMLMSYLRMAFPKGCIARCTMRRGMRRMGRTTDSTREMIGILFQDLIATRLCKLMGFLNLPSRAEMRTVFFRSTPCPLSRPTTIPRKEWGTPSLVRSDFLVSS